jgi:pimeloyl-ACP methyl ester carboxylesterase
MANLHVLHTASQTSNVALIFIHGLSGHYRETWMIDTTSKQTLWPKDLGDESDCDVWSLEYDASLSAWSDNAMPLPDQGDSVLDCLASEPALKDKHLILLGHSMGGLVIKTLLIHGSTKGVARYERVIGQVKGVVFIATPHKGSDLANLASWASLILRTNEQVGNMQNHDAHLRSLHQQFLAFCQNNPLSVRTYAETKPLLIGKKVLGLRIGATKLVVDSDSSEPHVPHEIAIRLPEDHISICKIPNRNAQLYKSLVSYLREDIFPKYQTPSKQGQTMGLQTIQLLPSLNADYTVIDCPPLKANSLDAKTS